MDGAPINVGRVIDEGRFTGFQITAIVLCSVIAFLDGLDTQSIAVVAPLIAENLHFGRAALGPVFAAAGLGAAIGAFTFGPLGDMFGRKRILALAAVIFGVFTVLTAFTDSYLQLLLVRVCAGIGLGGATPCFIALASEYAPARRRAAVASLMWAAFPLGGSLGSFINAFILAHYGWQNIFLFGGILAFIAAGVVLVWMPKSLRYLLATDAAPSRIAAIVRRIHPELPANARFIADEEHIPGVPVKHLFTEGRALSTLLLWVPFLTGFGILAIMVVWTPTLLRDNGISPAVASVAVGINGIGALIGMASAGRLMERFGTVPVLFPALLVGALATASLGYAASSLATMSVALIIAGLGVGMGASGAIALAALTYPTAIRSTGVGWAMGLGRFGQVVTPLLAAAMIQGGLTDGAMFLVFGVGPLLGALAILGIRAHARATAPAAA